MEINDIRVCILFKLQQSLNIVPILKYLDFYLHLFTYLFNNLLTSYNFQNRRPKL